MRAVSLAVVLLSALSSAQTVSHSLFDALPARLFYFAHSTILFYHDQLNRNVYRSADEGRTWNVVPGVPLGQAHQLVEHPADPRAAYVLTAARTHYRTTDRGATFHAFDTSLPPAQGPAALSFHAREPEWIIFTGENCDQTGGWKGRVCHDESFITRDAFATLPTLMLTYTSHCTFAHDKKEYSLAVPSSLVYCVAFEPPAKSSSTLSSLFTGGTLRESRLYSSVDYFQKDNTFVDLGIGREARGVVGIGGVQKFLVTALKPVDGGGNDGEMVLYVTQDGEGWSRALFPHGHGLRENAYTIVESTPHSILVDVNSSPNSITGTLFTSNSNGTYFVKSIEGTNRNKNGIVDFEKLVGVEGVAVVNIVRNIAEAERGEEKQLETKITFDDGGHWSPLVAPADIASKIDCSSDPTRCALHLHSVTQPHNFGKVFSSTAPGLVMGVGSVGRFLKPYEECDTFFSSDAGLTWRMVAEGARKYEFGDLGAILVMVDDEEPTDEIWYSMNFGKDWTKFDIGVHLRARLLTTVPDSTSLSFLLLGTLTRKSSDRGTKGERHIVVNIDFAALNKRKCTERDMEKWYARTIGEGKKADCLMGHKQWFLRRKEDADCVVEEKAVDSVGREEDCPCEDEDYECDYNFAPSETGECMPVGPESIPLNSCTRDGDKFFGSSGYRLIPGDSCVVPSGGGKDKKIEKDCKSVEAVPGLVSHKVFSFPGMVLDQVYFEESHTLLAFTTRNAVWQSSNEGFSWSAIVPKVPFVAMTIHAYSRDRAYLITAGREVHYTTDKGVSWNVFTAPHAANGLGIPLLDFHPVRADWLIWTGMIDCNEVDSTSCRAVASYTKDNGRNWYAVEEYVRVCTWGRDKRFKTDETVIFCESYRDKTGSQRGVFANNNPLQLVVGDYFYTQKKVVFPTIVGFATFEEYMVVAELFESSRAIGLEISMNGKDFALAKFPPNMHLENQAYTVLESTTDSIFLHVTTHAEPGSEWGSLFKSNSNGTYYTLSLDLVNRNGKGFVDFEKMVGLDGIAVVNVVSNAGEAAIGGRKKLQTRITHNDGGRWKSMSPPTKDALGRSYDCVGTKCALHIHGYTARKDARATYSSPSAVGLMLAVGNVGEYLTTYLDSDTFLTRDGGFTWEEVHKDAHIWEYGDQGSILLLANDEQVTDFVTYSLDEGLTWKDYSFGTRMRVVSISTVPMDTSRRFIVFGVDPEKADSSVAVHLDFSGITNVKCQLDLAHPANDDFELWSPSEEREERCLFGRQTLFHRRIRDRMCYIGERLPQPAKIERNCPCGEEDFECEFNYRRDASGTCVLVAGATPLSSDDSMCTWDTPLWYERTSVRKIPHSSCEGGLTLDRGPSHPCPGHAAHSWHFWTTLSLLPFFVAGLAAIWWSRRRGGQGRIRLPQAGEGSGGINEILRSVPWFLVGVIGATFAWLKEVEIPWLSDKLRRSERSGYRHVHLDDDAELLRDYDDEEE